MNSKYSQEKHIQNCISNETSVVLYFMNGYQMRGVIKNYDSETIQFQHSGRELMIYKHAISTIESVE